MHSESWACRNFPSPALESGLALGRASQRVFKRLRWLRVALGPGNVGAHSWGRWERKETYHFVLIYCLLLIYGLHCSMFYNVFSRNVKNNSCRQLSSLSTKLMRWFRHRMELVTECQLFIFGFRMKETRQKVGKHFFSYNTFQIVSFFLPPSLLSYREVQMVHWNTKNTLSQHNLQIAEAGSSLAFSAASRVASWGFPLLGSLCTTCHCTLL